MENITQSYFKSLTNSWHKIYMRTKSWLKQVSLTCSPMKVVECRSNVIIVKQVEMSRNYVFREKVQNFPGIYIRGTEDVLCTCAWKYVLKPTMVFLFWENMPSLLPCLNLVVYIMNLFTWRFSFPCVWVCAYMCIHLLQCVHYGGEGVKGFLWLVFLVFFWSVFFHHIFM